jgi:hypothetical protein
MVPEKDAGAVFEAGVLERQHQSEIHLHQSVVGLMDIVDLLQVRERATASLVRKGILMEASSKRPAGAAALHYAATFFDPTHSSATYRLCEVGAAKKATVVSQLRALLKGHPDSVDSTGASEEYPAQIKQQRVATARNVVLCVLARYSDVVNEVTEQWADEERRQAGERLSKLTAELQRKPRTTGQAEKEISSGPDCNVEASLYWIAHYFVR